MAVDLPAAAFPIATPIPTPAATPFATGVAASEIRLVLVALGSALDPAGPALLLPQVAARLSRLTGLPRRAIPQPDPAPQALATLLAPPGPWLAALPLDPGLPLAAGSWAEALGAWRQPTLLVVDSSQLATGLPAAATALLERWNVPLLGVMQWGGRWDPAARRRDGLAWIGQLAEPRDPDRSPGSGAAGAEAEAATDPQPLLAALELRWCRLIALLR